jgi:predicted enzyme related to lactoylglutathione lyase
MPRPIHFEIQAQDPARAQAFYKALFGWQFDQWGGQPYWLAATGDKTKPGIDGGLLPRPGGAPVDGAAMNAFVCTMDVEDLDAYLAKVPGLGGTVVVPKMPIPTMGWLAYAKDTEGNIFGMMQADPNAK